MLAAVAVALVAAVPALADGDPASGYLITQPVFFPFEPTKVSESAQNDLLDLLATSKDKGYEIRVAIIATRTDLGAVPALFAKPQRYADFLGQEIVYFWKGPLLVVMPNGFGFFKNGKPVPGEKEKLAQLPVPGSADGDALASAADGAVRALAQLNGVTLPAQTAEEEESSNNRDRFVLAGGVILLCAAALGARFLIARRRGASAA